MVSYKNNFTINIQCSNFTLRHLSLRNKTVNQYSIFIHTNSFIDDIGITCFLVLHFVLYKYFLFFFKLKVCGKHIYQHYFPTTFAYFVSVCITIFQTFFIIVFAVVIFSQSAAISTEAGPSASKRDYGSLTTHIMVSNIFFQQ